MKRINKIRIALCITATIESFIAALFMYRQNFIVDGLWALPLAVLSACIGYCINDEYKNERIQSNRREM